jgi:hypothetical protein
MAPAQQLVLTAIVRATLPQQLLLPWLLLLLQLARH